MSRTELNFLLDTLLLLLFSACFWVSAVVRFVFPPGPQADGWSLWGQNYTWWSHAQFVLMCAMALAVLLHVMLHWSWVCGVVVSHLAKNKKAKLDDGIRTLYGVGLLIILLHFLAISLAAAYFTVQPPTM